MEDLVMFGNAYAGKKVWLSGHTGFKGSWLSLWLLELGAEVTGFSLPAADGALFTQLGLGSRLHHEIGDVRDLGAVRLSMQRAYPDFVFHLAAQPLVRVAYDQPVETYAVNAMGTVHVLEALRSTVKPCAAVIVTTDKCYEERGGVRGHDEEDPLGGRDPYSSSKGMAELATGAYRRSYFQNHPTRVGSARAGNVLGGGDWALDRIVPDCIRALRERRTVAVRNPAAIRPWQHVLEPLSGYLTLAWALSRRDDPAAGGFDGAFNFGPMPGSNRTVSEVVAEVLKHWPGDWVDQPEPAAPHEAARLGLEIGKARTFLGWSPVWKFPETIEHTVSWYRRVPASDDAGSFTQMQITNYAAAARDLGLAWAQP